MTYRIRGWAEFYEKGRKPSEVIFRWVAIPTKHDGKGYRRLARHPDNVAAFCGWTLILQIAAKMPVRGVLADENGPLDAEDLADMTGFPPEIFSTAFTVLTDPKIGWLECFEGSESSGQVATNMACKGVLSGQVATNALSKGVLSSYRTVQDITVQNRTINKEISPCGEDRSSSIPEKPPVVSIFGKFWNGWPEGGRKADRKNCEKFWAKNNLDAEAPAIARGLKAFKVSQEWAEEDGRFIPAPLVWLRKRKWEANPAPKKTTDADGYDPRNDYTHPDYEPPAPTPEQLAAAHGNGRPHDEGFPFPYVAPKVREVAR